MKYKIMRRMHSFAINKEMKWQKKRGYDCDRTEEEETRLGTRIFKPEPPRHWLYSRILKVVYACGFIPF